MRKVLLQSGHQNTTSGATGAPGEMQTNIRFRDKLSSVLISKGFQLFLADANYVGKEDFDLALSIHCDADIYGTGGGFVDYPDPSVDFSNTESKRIKEAIESEYFKHSGIVNHPERSNANTKFYYWWSMLTAKTPCVIIETCVIQDAHDKVLAADPDIIPNAMARGICKAFNVAFDPVPPQPPEPPSQPPPQPPQPPDEPPVQPPESCVCPQVKEIVWDKWTWIGSKGWKARREQLKSLLPK
jgi:N-acetylmuramoyl-L-alanine amidase